MLCTERWSDAAEALDASLAVVKTLYGTDSVEWAREAAKLAEILFMGSVTGTQPATGRAVVRGRKCSQGPGWERERAFARLAETSPSVPVKSSSQRSRSSQLSSAPSIRSFATCSSCL